MGNKLFSRNFTPWIGFRKSAAGLGVFLLILSLTLLTFPANVVAKDYPVKPITLIAPWATGGAVDISGRLLAPRLSKILGVPVSVMNKPGGSGIIGTLEAVTAAPDGYTLLVDCGGTSSIQEAWVEKLPYKVQERTYIARVMYTSQALIVPASSPYKTVEELVNALRANPTGLSWTLVGGTGVTDVCTAQFRAALAAKGIDLSKSRMVAFKGVGEVVRAVAGGHADIGFGSPSTTNALISAGKLRPLAIADEQRYKGWPTVPSMAEAGFPSVNQVFWAGLCGPPDLPANVVKTINDAIRDVLRDPDLLANMDKAGFAPGYQTSDVFKQFVINESKNIKALRLK